MISKISFSNFKCLDGKSFELGKVNVFAGYNGRGKSSVIQSILMLSQSVRHKDINSFERLHLNGELIELGDFDELLTNNIENKLGFDYIISNGDEDHNVTLGYEMPDDHMVGKICECVIDDTNYFDSSGKLGTQEKEAMTTELTLQLPNFLYKEFEKQNVHFISADRQGPVKYVDKQEVPDVHRVGSNGCQTINTLSTYKDKVDIKMNLDPSDECEHSLLDSASSWINYIMDGGNVKIEDNTSSTLSLEFGFNNTGKVRSFQSYNVGFGYSYVLSIVVTALIAKEGNIVIIENPEAHLHPSAQIRVAYMLAKLAGRGVQVFVETHSEHVVNGFRLAVLKEEYGLQNEQVRIFFFDTDFKIIPLNIEQNGRINNWPSRFFDQYQKELAELLTLGAKVK
jgi:predicted ATPase